MKKFRITTIILLIAIVMSVFLAPAALALDDPDTQAGAVMLIDTATGQELYSYNADARMYPASTTKIMTVLLACEAIERGDVSPADNVTASENMSYDLISDGSSANILVGETMSLQNLMYCALLASGNDACNVIAEYIGGSISQFVDMMNARASELGCTGTHFANAHGIPNEDHYTTARDLSLIALAATESSLFMEICGTAEHTVPATNMSEARELSNSNALINENSTYGSSYYYEGATGMKTGYTSAAGYCLVSTASNGVIDALAVVLNSTATTLADGSIQINSFIDSANLYDWAFENFSYRSILRETEFVADAPVTMAAGTDTVSLRPQTSISLLLPNDADLNEYKRDITVYAERDGEELEAPIAAGSVLGEITVSKDGEVVGTVPLVTTTTVELSKTEYMKQQVTEVLHNKTVRKVFWICVILFCLYLLWCIIYRIRRIVHVNSVRRARRAQARASQQRAAARTTPPQRQPQPRQQAPAPQTKQPDIDFFSESEEAKKPTLSEDKQDIFDELFR
jgi:D-alanyl-D-alanine carboxypeptidase (penicillin-binding protein 5/6)